MKAFRITGPGSWDLIDLPRPEPAPGEVLLRVRRVGFCGSDLSTYRGTNALAAYPRVPGHEIAGIIEARGSRVPAEWERGREVTLIPYTNCGACPACRQGRPNCCRDNRTLGVQRDGGMAEYLAVPWEKLLAAPGLDLTELAFVEPLTVGFHAAARGAAGPGDRALVYGCGAIGLGAVAGAAARGARVIAVDIDPAKLALARAAGAAETLDASAGPIHGPLLGLTGGDGPSLVIEAAGQASTFRAAVEEVAYAGRVVYIGYAKEPVAYETGLFVRKELDIRGSRNASAEDFRDVVRLLEAGRFPVREALTGLVPLAEAGAALEAWSADPARVTKIQVEL